MTLTRAKLLHAGAWGILILLSLYATQYGPVKAQPWQGILIAVCLVLFVGLILLEIGVGVEKPDERAHTNISKANSLLFHLIDVALILYIAFEDKAPLIIPYEYVLLLVGLINVIQDLAFLYYERRTA